MLSVALRNMKPGIEGKSHDGQADRKARNESCCQNKNVADDHFERSMLGELPAALESVEVGLEQGNEGNRKKAHRKVKAGKDQTD